MRVVLPATLCLKRLVSPWVSTAHSLSAASDGESRSRVIAVTCSPSSGLGNAGEPAPWRVDLDCQDAVDDVMSPTALRRVAMRMAPTPARTRPASIIRPSTIMGSGAGEVGDRGVRLPKNQGAWSAVEIHHVRAPAKITASANVIATARTLALAVIFA